MYLQAVVNDSENGTTRKSLIIDCPVLPKGANLYDLSKKRQEEWLTMIKRDYIKKDKFVNIRVCSDHCITGTLAKLYDVSNPDWAPSLKLGYKSSQSTSGDSMQRYNKIVERNSRREFEKLKKIREGRDHIEQREDEEQSIEDAGNKDVEDGKAVQTDMTSQDLMKLKDESQHTQRNAK